MKHTFNIVFKGDHRGSTKFPKEVVNDPLYDMNYGESTNAFRYPYNRTSWNSAVSKLKYRNNVHDRSTTTYLTLKDSTAKSAHLEINSRDEVWKI